MAMQKPPKYRFLPWVLGSILASVTFVLGWPNGIQAQSSQTATPEAATMSANEAFRAAYENRYTWDEQFPGYSAEVSINYGEESDQGIVRINPDLSVEVTEIDKEELRELIANQFQMEVVHRRRIPFEELHGQKIFEMEGTDESGALKIREVDDEMDSHFKVKDNVITQVNRLFGEVAATVDTLETMQTPEGYLVKHFQTTFRNPQTNEVIEKQDVRDVHEKIGNYYLLTERTIREVTSGNSDEQVAPEMSLKLNNVQPL